MKMNPIHLLACLMLFSACFADEANKSKRISRSLDLDPLHLLPFNLFGKEPETITPVVAPIDQQTILTPNLPIWKIHKYNGIKLNPVSLSSLPYVQVPIAPPLDETQGLPSLSEVMSLLGTTTTVETLAAIKEIASTRDGLRLIANFVKTSLNKPQMTEEQVGSLISNYKFSPPLQEFTHIPSQQSVPAQYYGPPTHRYGPPLQNYPPPPSTYGPPPPTSYRAPVQFVSPPATVHEQPFIANGLPLPHSRQRVNFASSADENKQLFEKNQQTAEFSGVNQFASLPQHYSNPAVDNSKFVIESENMNVANNFDNIAQSEQNGMSFFNLGDQINAHIAPTNTVRQQQLQPEHKFDFASSTSNEDGLQEDQNRDTGRFSNFNQFKPLPKVYGTPKAPAKVNVVDNSKFVVESEVMSVSDSFDNSDSSEQNGMSSFKEHNQKPAFVSPEKTYGLPNQYTASVSGSQEDGNQENVEQKKDIFEENSESLNDESQTFILPSEESKSTFKVKTPVMTYGPPKNTYGIPVAPEKPDVFDSSSGVVIETDHSSVADAFDNNEQVFILPSEDTKSTFQVDVPTNIYGFPSKTHDEVEFSQNTDAHDSSASFDEEIEQTPIENSFEDNIQGFIPSSEGNKGSFKVDMPTIVYGRPVKSYETPQAPISFAAQSQSKETPTFTVPSQEIQEAINGDTFDSISAPLQFSGQPQSILPTQSTFDNSQGSVNGEFTFSNTPYKNNFGSFDTPEQNPSTQFGNPSGIVIPFSQTYPGYEPTPVGIDVQKTVGGFSEPFLPFPILPNLPSLPDAEHLAAGQLGTNFFEKISPENNNFAASAYTNPSSFSYNSGPTHTQNYQREGFIPTGDPNNKYLYSVQQSSLTTGITDPGVKVTNYVTQEDGRPVNSLNYDHPNFSYTQLSKIPLETGPRFYKYPGQVSSYGEAVPSYIFQEDNAPYASEQRAIVVAPENKAKEVKKEETRISANLPAAVNQDNKNKMVVEQKSVVVSNNPRKHIFERRPWVSLSQRKIGQQNITPSPPTPITAALQNKQPAKQTSVKQ